MLPTLWQQFGEGPLLFQHDNAPVHKVKSIQKWFVEIGVKELDWLAQSPDLNMDQLHVNAHDFGMRRSTSRYSHTFGHVVYLKKR